MARIEIKRGEASDRDAIIAFIKSHWRANHIFVEAPDVFEWQYSCAQGGYNMVLAVLHHDDGSQDILGVLGYIPTGKYDEDLNSDQIVLAVWKVREDLGPPGLGLRLLKFVQSTLKPNFIGAIGISEQVDPIYKALGYQVGDMDQFALFNPDFRNSYCVAGGVPDSAFQPHAVSKTNFHLREIPAEPSIELRNSIDTLCAGPGLHKSWDYILNRYVNHPWYTYQILGGFDTDDLRMLFVIREVGALDSKVLRIVDIVGPVDSFPEAKGALQELLAARTAEYIDLVSFGLDRRQMEMAGFICTQDVPDLVLPNFFAPFEKRNVVLRMAAKSFLDGNSLPQLFRADADQDRPNLVAEL